jgi:hypothetical protein
MTARAKNGEDDGWMMERKWEIFKPHDESRAPWYSLDRMSPFERKRKRIGKTKENELR